MKQHFLSMAIFLSMCSGTLMSQQYSWRYYNTGNTGIQGDYVEAIWIDHDGNPYIAGYTPGWEEGGFAKYVQTENRWINYSNIDYPVIGDINDVGASRISDIVEDANGVLWMAHWRGLLKFDPSIGPDSFEFWGAGNSVHPGGRSREIAMAPDGSLWIAVVSVTWGNGGLVNYNPSTNQWRYWGYGSTSNNWPGTISNCDNVSIQEKPGGGYTVWVSASGGVIAFDSNAQLFTLFTFDYNPGELVKSPGHNCVDDQNNLWMIRFNSIAPFYFLDYQTQNGQWQTPVQPPVSSVLNEIWAFKAYGNQNALLVDGNSEVWHFNGVSWTSKGAWKDGAYTYAVDLDDNGNIWTTGIGGAAKRDVLTGQWQRYRITNSSQIDYWVEDISIDAEGNVWMTGNGGPGVGGFQKFDGTRWIGYNELNYGLGFPFPFPTDNTEVIYSRPSNGHIVVNPMFNYLHAWNGTNYTSLNYPNDRSEGVVEDSQGRLWSIGEYYNLKYLSGNSWIDVPFLGWGANIGVDPTRPGTIWACSGYQALRTDGTYSFSKVVDDFSELNPQSDFLNTVVPLPDGYAWVGTNQGLAKVNANNGAYQFYSPSNSQIPGESITPLVVTPDGRLWFANFGSTTTSTYGLCWYDGTNFGIIPQTQTGGLPHAQIYDIEVKLVDDGYELWISCASRGIAVLYVVTTTVGVELAIAAVEPELFIENYPNPFTDFTSVNFSIAEPGLVHLAIYDINGKIIRDFGSQRYEAGASAVVWDGIDSRGLKVKPGVYVCRMTMGYKTKSIRIIAN
ncbi:MAG: T9SS type A sorting domain-containing protein [Bacteroidales bacterium]|nr:T9SS type A sorting domain-containing protein [Bacteroidales bacterium]